MSSFLLMILSFCCAIHVMVLISSASNPELYLVLGFSYLGSFWLVLLSSQLLCWYHSVLCCLFLFLIPLTILHFFHVLSHYPICYSRTVYSLQHFVFHYWYFSHHPSVGKLFSDLRQISFWPYTVVHYREICKKQV